MFGPYFTEKELGIEKAEPEIQEKMYLLTKFALSPIRKKYGPTIITSGYRSPEYNAGLAQRGYKPSKTSQHMTGEACDFVCKNAKMREVFEWLREWWPGQLLYYPKKGHVHIALPNMDLQKRGRLYALVMEEK